MVTGMIPSGIDERDIVFKAIRSLPDEYKLSNIIPVKDQGMKPICAAITLLTILKWKYTMNGAGFDCNEQAIFDLRTPPDLQGMIPRQALKALKSVGVCGRNIKSYAKVDSVEAAKTAILLNGPVLLGTNAYEGSNHFWRPSAINMGGHATTLIGWDRSGFVLQNSWGYEWANSGQIIFPFEDWNHIVECWTVLL